MPPHVHRLETLRQEAIDASQGLSAGQQALVDALHDLQVERGRAAEGYRAVVQSLTAALEARDGYTSDHSDEVQTLAVAVAGALGLGDAEIAEVQAVAILHDIGKIGIPDRILHKAGPLDDEEWALMREHPVIGERILRPLPGLSSVAAAVRHEHERWDGAGYPDGLRWEGERDVLRTLYNAGHLAPGEVRRPADETWRLEEHDMLRRLLLEGNSYIGTVDDPEMHEVERELLLLHGCRSSAAVPIMFGGVAWGEMWATRRDDQPDFSQRDLRFLQAIAGQLATAIGRAELFSRMAELALTGAANRRAFEERLETSVTSALASGRELALVLCDVDHLKLLNAAGGHEAGDAALRRAADAALYHAKRGGRGRAYVAASDPRMAWREAAPGRRGLRDAQPETVDVAGLVADVVHKLDGPLATGTAAERLEALVSACSAAVDATAGALSLQAPGDPELITLVTVDHRTGHTTRHEDGDHENLRGGRVPGHGAAARARRQRGLARRRGGLRRRRAGVARGVGHGRGAGGVGERRAGRLAARGLRRRPDGGPRADRARRPRARPALPLRRRAERPQPLAGDQRGGARRHLRVTVGVGRVALQAPRPARP